MAIKAIDFKFRDQTTYLNDGFDVSGKSLNPMDKYWVTEDGRMFERNSFGSFKQTNQSFERFQDTGDARTRLHSGYGGIIQYEQNRASEMFDSSKLISKLPDSFGYYYEYNERIDEEMKRQMLIEEQTAKELLTKKYLQARW
jgi:hypothetical protein